MKKITSLLKLLLILTLAYYVTAQNPPPTITFTNSQVLQSPDLYYLYWNYNTQNITFEVHVKYAVWVMFGLRGSSYSDIIVGAIFNDGTGHYSQRTLFSNNTISTNPSLDWFLQDAFKSNNYTVLKFQRNLIVQCGQTPSRPSLDITKGLNTVVFASGTSFSPVDTSINITNLNSSQINMLPTISADVQLTCVTQPSGPVFNSTPTASYANEYELIPGVYKVFWNITNNELNFTAEIHVKTQGWVGFGFSKNGEMEDSNVVVGYIATDGSVNFTDRYITEMSLDGVKIAKNQSVQLLGYGRIGDYIYFKFTRYLKICDSEHLIISVVF